MSQRIALPEAPRPFDPLDGTPYRTLAPLGAGGMGEVVEAEHVALAKRVVVKLLHRRLSHRSELVARMQLEGQALAHLSHPNIVAVTDLQMTPKGRPYLVMERLYGRTLRAELEARSVLPVAEAVALTQQALAGLAAAHDAGILHRDIKLENLFLCDAKDSGAQRVVKILDFGVAKIMEARQEGTPAPLHQATDEGVSVGTPLFFSPEQVRYEPLDERTDLYAMGIVIYTLVAGRGPFDHLTELFDILEAHLSTRPAPPSSFAPQSVAPEMDEVILKALAKRQEDRFPNARAFAEALSEAMRPRPRWVSTEPLDRSKAPLTSPASPFAAKPPPPNPRWSDTEPLPTLRREALGAALPPPDPTKLPER